MIPVELSMSELVVGIDSGTQSVRVIIYDLQGRCVAKGTARHAPLSIPSGGSAKQEPSDLWESLCRASRQAVSALPAGVRLASASLASQRSVLVAVDQSGAPLRPAFSWLDNRRAEEIPPLPEMDPVQRELQVRSKANWMLVHEPELYQKTWKFLSASGWLTYNLCSEFRDSIGGLGGIFPLDVKQMAWSGDPVLYSLLGMPLDKLPVIYPPGERIGYISRAAASQTGLPQGLLLFAGAGDKSCEMLGAGALSQFQGYISYGTLAALEAVTSRPIFSPENNYWTIPGALPGTWNLEYGIEYGYLLVSWFCEQLVSQKITEINGQPLEEWLGAQALAVPPGSGGLLLSPLGQSGGLAEIKTALLELSQRIPPTRVFRMILEGIAYRMRAGLEVLEQATGVKIREILIGGGGAQGDLPVQITADILGLPVYRPQTVQTCALGAAVLAAVGAGLYPSCTEAVTQMCSQKEQFLPDPDRQKVYDTIYTTAFQMTTQQEGKIITEFSSYPANKKG